MKTAIRILFLPVIFLFSSLINLAFADDDVVKFKLEIKPNQQKVEAKIDGDERKQIQIRAEYVKLNTVTNNYHIKVTITNNSGQILYHQLALIDKIEHSEVKYPDSTTDYIKNDDGKQITKTLPYYNYGNIKPAQATPREWYLSNTGKDEMEVKGYIISKEIPIVLDPKIVSQLDSATITTITNFLMGLRDNDLDKVLLTIAPPDIYLPRDLHKPIKTRYGYSNQYFPLLFLVYKDIQGIGVIPSKEEVTIRSKWLNGDDGKMYGSIWVIDYFDNKSGWLITEY